MALLLDIFGFLTVILRGLSISAQAFTLGGIGFVLFLATPLRGALGTTGDTILTRSLRITFWSALTIAGALTIAALCRWAPTRLLLAAAAFAVILGSTLTSHAVARLDERLP